MTIARGSRIRMAYAQESTYGTQATTWYQQLPLVSDGLKQGGASIESTTIRSDRQRTGVRRSQIDASGAFAGELSYGAYDDFIAAAMLAANVKAQGTLTIDATPSDGNTFTIGATTYRLKTTMAQANDIKLGEGGSALADTQAAIVKVINGTGTVGVDYYTGTTTPNASVRMTSFATNVSTLTAVTAGMAGNAIATTETFTPETDIFNAAVLGTTTAGAGWTAPITVSAATISAASADNSFSDSANGLGSLVANQWIKVSGFANAANNGYFKISTVTAAKIVVVGGTLVTAAATPTITIKQGAYLTNGTTLNSFSMEREYTDLASGPTKDIATVLGCIPNQLTITAPTTGAVTISFDMLGTKEDSATSSVGAGYFDATNTAPITALDLQVKENYTNLTTTNFTLTINNNARQRFVHGGSGVHSVGDGQLAVNGSLSYYYESSTLYDKYIDDTETSLAACFTDVNGNGYVFEVLACRFTPGGQGREAPGVNADIMPNLNYAAFMDTTELKTIRIAKFAA